MPAEEREMTEGHVAQLKQCLSIAEHEQLPEKLVEKYWEFKRIFDRVGAQLRLPDLALLGFLHGHGKPTAKEKAPPTVVDMWRKKQIKAESPVIVKWKGAEVEGVLKSVTSNDGVIVQMVGDPDERKFEVADVRPAA